MPDVTIGAHSVCTADKALGQNYGVAKEATLIVVQLGDGTDVDYFDAFNAIEYDLRTFPERRKHSVVTSSVVFTNSNFPINQRIRSKLKSVMDMDVPIVVPAGNEADDPSRQFVDQIPAFWAGAPGFPIIVVGSVNAAGQKSTFSQGGNKVTTHAVGEDITCYWDHQIFPVTNAEGTSYGKSYLMTSSWGFRHLSLTFIFPPSSCTPGRWPDSYSARVRYRALRHHYR
jgi:hypothetical protein